MIKLMLLLLPVIVKGQLTIKSTPVKQEVGKVRDVEMYRLIQKKDSLVDSVYVISFRNEEYKNITDYKSFFFRNKEGEINGLYDVLKSFYSKENLENKDYKVNLKLYKTDLYLSRYKKDIWFSIGSAYFILGEKDIDKLFGRSTQ